MQDEEAMASNRYSAEDILKALLSKLGHMDLTGCVSYKNDLMVANGGYSDVFVGTTSLKHLSHRVESEGGEVKVAIKRFRVHLLDDRKLCKVRNTVLTRNEYIDS